MGSIRIVGAGRAGGSFALALGGVGWVPEVMLRGVPLEAAAEGVDVVLLCVPDGAVAEVAASIRPNPSCVVVHCAGSLTLDVLDPHPVRASVHPLVSLPSPTVGAQRLAGAWFGVAADPPGRDRVDELVGALDGRAVEVADRDRATYHAAAAMASNHLVALLGQVERTAASVGVPLEAYLDLARGSLTNVAELGPAAALTGPVSRGDWATVAAHLAALPAEERPAYEALARAAARLCGRELPDL